MIIIPEEKIELVQKFVDKYHETQDCIDNKDITGATTKYSELLDIYKEIASSKLDPMHKELAYDQLVKIYNTIQNPPKASIHATTHIIAAAILLVLFSFMVFFKPVVFGAVTISPEEKVVQDLNWAFIESESRSVHLEAVPKSLRISGKIDGNGFVSVYAVTPNSRTLLFDKDIVKTNKDGTFTAACVKTCNQKLDTQDIQLDVEIENSALTIYTIEYTK
ncbi:MAG: hypothetical protein QXR48_01350 [Candidatus Woesearchaeota archaeon]